MFIFNSRVAIVCCKKGRGKIVLNNKRYTFRSGANFVILNIHHPYFESCSDDMQVVVIDYASHFFNIITNILEKSLLQVVFTHNAPDLCSTESLRPSRLSAAKIRDLYYNTSYHFRHRYLVSLTLCYFTERYEAIANCCNVELIELSEGDNHHFTRFRELCEQDHMRERNIKIYAEKIGVSTRHLYDVVKSAVGLTPKQVLTEQVIYTAKKMLLTTNKSVQEIAYEMHFCDQSNFAQYFKKYCGETPVQFRQLYFNKK